MDNRLVLQRSLWVTLITPLSIKNVLNHWSFSRDVKIVGVFSGFASQGRTEAKHKRRANSSWITQWVDSLSPWSSKLLYISVMLSVSAQPEMPKFLSALKKVAGPLISLMEVKKSCHFLCMCNTKVRRWNEWDTSRQRYFQAMVWRQTSCMSFSLRKGSAGSQGSWGRALGTGCWRREDLCTAPL